MDPRTSGAAPDGAQPPAANAYEPPAIAWEEPFLPVSQVTGCNFLRGEGGGCSIQAEQ